MTNYPVTIIEGDGGYISSGYVGDGYVIAGTTITESLAGNHGAVRALSQTVTLTGLIPNLFIGRGITQTITNVNSISRHLAALREVGDSGAGYIDTGYVSSGYLTSGGLLISEVLGRVRNVPRALTETMVNTNAVARIYGAVRTLTPTLTIVGTVNRIYGAVRTITPTLTTTDSVARALIATRTIVETLTLTTLLVAFKGVAGAGARRIFEVTTSMFKRSGTTSIFKRKTNTSA